MIRQISANEAALLVPLNRVVQDVHVHHRPDLFAPTRDEEGVMAFFHDWLDQPHMLCLVAFTGPKGAQRSTAVGYGVFELQERAATVLMQAETRGVLHHIAVLPSARRRGVARGLINEGCARLKSLGAQRITTSYHCFNTGSRDLMHRAGFRPAVVSAELIL